MIEEIDRGEDVKNRRKGGVLVQETYPHENSTCDGITCGVKQRIPRELRG